MAVGMIFFNAILYCIILSTGATLLRAGLNNIETAADAAKALEPLAGGLAKALFVIGLVGVGVLAVPVMTIGAAYDLAEGSRKRNTLNAEPRQAPFFYGTIAVVTAAAVILNFLGFNPMHALVSSGIVHGFSVPPLLLLIMFHHQQRQADAWPVEQRACQHFVGWLEDRDCVRSDHLFGRDLDTPMSFHKQVVLLKRVLIVSS